LCGCLQTLIDVWNLRKVVRAQVRGYNLTNPIFGFWHEPPGGNEYSSGGASRFDLFFVFYEFWDFFIKGKGLLNS